MNNVWNTIEICMNTICIQTVGSQQLVWHKSDLNPIVKKTLFCLWKELIIINGYTLGVHAKRSNYYTNMVPAHYLCYTTLPSIILM